MIKINGKYVSILQTLFSTSAFLIALLFGLKLHYKKLCKNAYHRYPKEYFPSVSTTIGDFYPERSIYQFLIALTSFPRFLVILLNFIKYKESNLVYLYTCINLLRTLCCGGWTYVTSTDNGFTHDCFMLLYIIFNFIYLSIGTQLTNNGKLKKFRLCLTLYFISSLLPMFYQYFEHKLNRIPGAYTRYAFFEWALIITDIVFDAVSIHELKDINLNLLVEIETPKRNDGTKEGIPNNYEKLSNEDYKIWLKSLNSFKFNILRIFNYISDSYLSFIWWTNFTALPICIFYYSVWSLSFAGSEALMFITLICSIINYKKIQLISTSKSGNCLLTLISLLGLLSNLFKYPLLKLALISISILSQTVKFSSDIYNKNLNLNYISIQFLIGLLIHLVIKLYGYSNNPLWPIMNETNGSLNYLGLFISLMTLFVKYYIPMEIQNSHTFEENNYTVSSLVAGLGLGSYIWSLHTYLSDSSTLLSWSFSGFPSISLHQVYDSHFIILGYGIGIIISMISNLNVILQSISYQLVGLLVLLSAYFYHNWTSAISSIVFSIYLPSISIITFKPIRNSNPTKTLLVTFLTYNLLLIGHTFTVAYEFVPFGNFLRERSHIIFTISQIFICNLIYKNNDKHHEIKFYFVSLFKKFVILLVIFLTFSSHFILNYRFKTFQEVKPYHEPNEAFTVGIWTVHFGMDDEMWDSQKRMRDLILDSELDVIGLLETDLHRIVFGNRDLTQYISENLGYYVDYGPSSKHHTWGAVLLSKFPIIESIHHLLPSPQGELAPAIHAKLDVFGEIVNVVVSHNGQEESPLDRELQTKEIANIFRSSYPNSAIFLGYLVTKPQDLRPSPYKLLFEDGLILDIEPLDRRRWCEVS